MKINPIKDREPYKDKETGASQIIFHSNDDISGEVDLRITSDGDFDHAGVNVELIGKISKQD